jgi:ABC-type Fe3+-siderophore transport system permease subunit
MKRLIKKILGWSIMVGMFAALFIFYGIATHNFLYPLISFSAAAISIGLVVLAIELIDP